MSRKSQRNPKKHSKKRRGRPKVVANAPRGSSKRKRCRSYKKLQKKFKRGKAHCTICINTERGAKMFLACGHVFHRNCIKRGLKKMISKCPNCRKYFSRNTGQREQLLNMDLENTNYNVDNPSTDLENSSNLNNPTMDEAQWSDLDNSNIYTDDRSSDMDNSNTDTSDSSHDFDNPTTDAPTPSSYFDIPGKAFPRPSRNSNKPSLELPVLFVPVLCCRHELDSNAQPERDDFGSNENNRAERILENGFEDLHRNSESNEDKRSGRILENNEELHTDLESNENIRPRRILWDDNDLERQIRILRILLEDRDFTLKVLNSPAQLDTDLMLNHHRRYISTVSIPDFLSRHRVH